MEGRRGPIAAAWWVFPLRALNLFAFAALTLMLPPQQVALFASLFAAFALADGLLLLAAIGFAPSAPVAARFGPEAGVDFAVGMGALVLAGLGEALLLALLVLWALGRSLPEYFRRTRLASACPGARVLAVDAQGSVLLAGVLAVLPGTALDARLWVVAGYACVSGALLLIAARCLRQARARPAA